jgi:hypothetical protein
MTDSSTESPTNGSTENWYDAIANMVTSLAGAIKDLPHWQRLGGFSLVVAVIPITLAVYSLSSDSNKLILLSVIFLAWISSLMFVVYAFTERQGKLKEKQEALNLENTKLDELRASLLDAVEDKHQSLLEIGSRLEKISNEVGALLRDHQGLTSSVIKLKNSVDTLIRDIKDDEGSYDDFLQLMSGTESMRQSKSVAASILVSESSRKSSNKPQE